MESDWQQTGFPFFCNLAIQIANSLFTFYWNSYVFLANSFTTPYLSNFVKNLIYSQYHSQKLISKKITDRKTLENMT